MIIQKFEAKAKKKSCTIGIGLGVSKYHNQKILTASENFLQEYNSDIWFFGRKKFLNELLEYIPDFNEKSRMKLIECQDPENSIIKSLENNSIHSIVRGSLDSSKFIKEIKISLKTQVINRLALLETYDGYQFFYGPVGIDECNNLENKFTFVKSAIKELDKLDVTPKISILSGGRKGDIGRDVNVDQTIQEAEKIVELVKKNYPNTKISHDEILIEKALENKSNLIIAPNGFTGNLIYRTLVHLGGGKAYGAIYMGIKSTIIDTSRVGNYSEIYGALTLAAALS